MIKTDIVFNNEANQETEADNNQIVFDNPISPNDRENLYMLSKDNLDYMKAYRGDIGVMQLQAPAGLLWNTYVNFPKSFARGVVGTIATAPKAFEIGQGLALQFFSDVLETNVYNSQRAELKSRLDNKEIDQEQYDLAMSDLETSKLQQLDRLNVRAENDAKKTSMALQKMDYLQYKLNEFLNLNRKEGEWGWVSDLGESAPTTLGSIGLLYLTKNPKLSVAFMTGVVGTDVIQSELEKGQDIYSAVLTGASTGFASSLLDVAGQGVLASMWGAPSLQFVTRNKLFNKMVQWTQKNEGTTLAKNLKNIVKSGFVGGGEEFVTEGAQGVIETNLPRFLGQGDEFISVADELMNYGYQALVGGLGGVMFGGTGSMIRTQLTHNDLFSWAKEHGAKNDAEASNFASEMTPIIVEQQERVVKKVEKDFETFDTSEAGVDGAIKTLLGGTTAKDRDYIRQDLVRTLSKKNPDNAPANEIASDLLFNAIELQSQVSQIPADKIASTYDVDIRTEREGLSDISEKGYNSRVRKESGRERVEGAVKKDLASNVIYLLNDANPDTIIHESGHLLLKAITNAIQQTGGDAYKHPLVHNIIAVVGLPKGQNSEFSTEQHEQFAEALQEYIVSGEAPSPALVPLFQKHKVMMERVYRSANENKLLTKSGRENFSKLFASEEVDLPSMKLTEANVKALTELIAKAKRGDTLSYKEAKILAEWVRFGESKAPIPTGMTLSEFIAEHPEYNTLNNKNKRALLARNMFEGASDRKTYPSDADYIKLVEENADNVYSVENEKAKARQKKYDEYNEYRQVYEALMPKDRKEIVKLAEAFRTVLASGRYAITDKDFLDTVSGELKNLLNIIKEYNRKDIEKAKSSARELVRVVKALRPTMEITGIKIEGVDKIVEDLEEAVFNSELVKINEKSKSLLNRFEVMASELINNYINSRYFAERENVMPPVVNEEAIVGDILSVLAKRLFNGEKLINNPKVIKDVRNMLRVRGVGRAIVDEIVNKMVSMEGSLTTDKRVQTVKDIVVSGVSKDYKKEMVGRIDKAFKDLVSKANKNNLSYADVLFVKWLNDNVVQYRKNLNSKGLKSLRTTLPLYYQSINTNDVVVGKDPITGKDIVLNEEQKNFTNSMMNYIMARDIDKTISNDALYEMYKDVNRFSLLTGDFFTRQQMEKEEAVKKDTQHLIDIVRQRKDIPKVLSVGVDYMFTRLLAGLRSNLIKVFGRDTGGVLDVLIEERTQQIVLNRIWKNVDKYITNKTKMTPAEYRMKLERQVFANAKKGTVEYELRELTIGQLMSIWITDKNQIGNEWVVNNFGNKAESVVKKIDETLSQQDKEIAEKLMLELRKLHPDISRVFFEINGRNMGKLENYWPIVTEGVSSKKVEQESLDAFNVKPAEKKEEKFTIKRLGPVKEEDGTPKRVAVWQNPVSQFMDYTERATKFIYVVPKLNRISKMLKGKTRESLELQNAIKEKFGENTLRSLQNDIEYIMGLGPRIYTGKLEKVLHGVVSNWVIAKLGLKPMVAIKQVPGFINFAEVMPTGAFISGVQDFMSNPKKNFQNMYRKHKSIRDRFEGTNLPIVYSDNRSMIMDTMLENFPKMRSILNQEKLEKASAAITDLKNKSMLNVRLGDITAVIIGAYSYEKYLREMYAKDPNYAGYSKSELDALVEQKLIEAIETTQQSGLETTKGSLQQNVGGVQGVLVRSMLSFSTAQAQFARKVREAYYEYVNDKISKEEFIKTCVIYGLVQPAIYASLTTPATILSALRWLMLGGADDEGKDELYLALIRPYIDNIAGAGGAFGGISMGIVDAIARKMGQKTYGDEGDLTPPIVQDIMKAVNGITKEDVTWEDFFASSSTISELGTGIPLQTSAKMLKGLWESILGVGEADPKEFGVGLGKVFGVSPKQVENFFEEE